MKVSLNSIKGLNKRYQCADDVTKIGVDTLIDKIGAQLGAVEELIDNGSKYDGVLIVKVLSCDKHPNADKLSVCLIDDGGVANDVARDGAGHVQVVCGAPNVQAGQTVAWLPPGSTVPESVGKDPFVLEARELRGVVSNGMLASPKELALGDSHEGLLILDDDTPAGTHFSERYELQDDIVLDIENKMFTHRPDCFGFLGIARELAGIQSLPFKSPEWYAPHATFPDVGERRLPLTVQNELPALVPRFTMIALSDVQVGPSPIWLQVELAKVGQKSINNIVDYTNFFMLETGQPLHAYDYDKVAALTKADGATIVVRNPRASEKLRLLNGKEIDPRQEAIMIATDTKLIGVGGVMGGSETEVDSTTKNILVECGNFDMYSVRRTSMAHGLFTDAVARFNKGQSPLQNLGVLARIVNEIVAFAGGSVASEVVDLNHLDETVISRASLHVPVTVKAEFINSRLGLTLSPEEMQQLLQNVEFSVAISGDELRVQAPFWRTDIELREDIVEEIGRLYGYDKLPLKLPARVIAPAERNKLLDLKTNMRNILSAAGANEVLTYSFVHGDLLTKVGQDISQAYQISNALSPDLQYYRLSLTPSLLDKVHPNSKAGYDNFALFEIGKTHILGKEQDGVPIEFERLAFVTAANKKAAERYSEDAYYAALDQLQNLVETVGLADELKLEPLTATDKDSATVYYEPGRAATIYIGGQIVGRIGEYKASVRRALKLPDFTAGFELGLTPLLALSAAPRYTPIPKFPSVNQDITLKIPADLSHQQVREFMLGSLLNLRPKNTVSQMRATSIYQSEADTETKNITFRVTIASYERTLTDPEVTAVLDKISAAAKETLKAERI